MKKINNFLSLAFAGLLLIFAACSSSKCGSVCDRLCDLLDTMTEQVEKTNSLESLLNVDLRSVAAGEEFDLSDIPDECAKEKITDSEKRKLKNSITKLIDTMSGKLVSFSNGLVSQEEVNNQLSPIAETFNHIIDSSVTWEDFVQSMRSVN